ncbi:MAG: sulfatase-like hydrolase/transferase [Eubacteriales bacterium]|nr:sulfatase-like hydrolase/transferase [Eubacteriales bacterium]
MPKHDRQVSMKKINVSVYFLISTVFWEIVFAAGTVGFNLSGIFLSTVFAIATSLILFSAEKLIRRKIFYSIVFVFLIMIAVIFSAQKIYFNIFNTFFTIYSAANGGQVMEFIDIIILEIISAAGWILIFSLPPVFYHLFTRRDSANKKPVIWQILIPLWFAVTVFVSAIIGLNFSSQLPGQPYHSYYISHEPVSSVRNLGLITTIRLDIQSAIGNILPGTDGIDEGPPVIDIDQPIETSSANNQEQSSSTTTDINADHTSETGSESSDTSEDFIATPAVLNTDFADLATTAADDDIADIHRWVSQREIAYTNSQTGRFEGYNLIFITAESYSHLAIDPDITPTLYKMQHEGINFTEFYNPLWGVSTSDGEYVAVTGLLPKPGVWSMYHSGKNSMPFAMGNQLRDRGYLTLAYHNHTYDYYRRDISHPNLGYEYKGLGNGLDVAKTWPESDLEMMEKTIDEYIGQEPFHAYYMTVSGHLQYNYNGNFIARKNQDLVENLNFSEPARAYLATQIELDRALKYLLGRLEQANVDNRTLIVMSADHYPYGLDHEDIENLAGHQVNRNFELYRSSLIIYAPGMEPMTVSEPVSSLDIMPTLSNLLGLDYDSRLFMGRDVFSNQKPQIIFQNRSFITDQGRYNATDNTWEPISGSTTDDEYIISQLNEIEEKFYYSKKILEEDYYSSLEPD